MMILVQTDALLIFFYPKQKNDKLILAPSLHFDGDGGSVCWGQSDGGSSRE